MRATAHALHKSSDAVAHAMYLRVHVHAVHNKGGRAAGRAQRHVQHGAALRGVDALPRRHGTDAVRQARL